MKNLQASPSEVKMCREKKMSLLIPQNADYIPSNIHYTCKFKILLTKFTCIYSTVIDHRDRHLSCDCPFGIFKRFSLSLVICTYFHILFNVFTYFCTLGDSNKASNIQILNTKESLKM